METDIIKHHRLVIHFCFVVKTVYHICEVFSTTRYWKGAM